MCLLRKNLDDPKLKLLLRNDIMGKIKFPDYFEFQQYDCQYYWPWLLWMYLCIQSLRYIC